MDASLDTHLNTNQVWLTTCILKQYRALFKQIVHLFVSSLNISISAVNNTSELGPVKVMNFLSNETSFTLGNLNSSMLYKFYLSAKTIKGSGPTITEEAFTVLDTGEFMMFKR